jgi:hypothetical protein
VLSVAVKTIATPANSLNAVLRSSDIGRPHSLHVTVFICRVVSVPKGTALSTIYCFCCTARVRFWHKADIPTCSINVRFGGKADITQTSEFAVMHNAALTHGCGGTKFLWQPGNRARFARAIAIDQCPLLEQGHRRADWRRPSQMFNICCRIWRSC